MYSEEGKQATAKRAFVFTRAYTKQKRKPQSGAICEADGFCEYPGRKPREEEGKCAAAKQTFVFTRAYMKQ